MQNPVAKLVETAAMLRSIAEHVDANEKQIERLFAENNKLETDMLLSGAADIAQRITSLEQELKAAQATIFRQTSALRTFERNSLTALYRLKGANKRVDKLQRQNRQLRIQLLEAEDW